MNKRLDLDIKLLNNRAYGESDNDILNKDNDFFGNLNKAKAIKSALDNYTNAIKENNMIALYGPWGSGKTSIMRYLEREMSNTFECVFFPVWQLEGTKDLKESLLETIVFKLLEYSKTKITREIKKIAESCINTFIIAMKNTNFNLSILPEILSASFDFNKAIDESNKISEAKYGFNSSMHLLSQFKIKLNELVEICLDKNKRIFVFIDDLDRCTPEGIIDLLNSIKLFFSYNTNITYMIGIDKQAISNALKHRYKDIIKSEEYLEKIFDLSFSVPENIDKSICNLLKEIFSQESSGYIEESEYIEFINLLCDFFINLKFTNPRKIKKVINSFLLIRFYTSSGTLSNYSTVYNKQLVIPHVVGTPRSPLNHLNIFFQLFLIIIYLFDNNTFNDVLDKQMNINNITEFVKLPDSGYKHIGEIWASDLNTLNKITSSVLKESSFRIYVVDNENISDLAGLFLLLSPKFDFEVNGPYRIASNAEITKYFLPFVERITTKYDFHRNFFMFIVSRYSISDPKFQDRFQNPFKYDENNAKTLEHLEYSNLNIWEYMQILKYFL